MIFFQEYDHDFVENMDPLCPRYNYTNYSKGIYTDEEAASITTNDIHQIVFLLQCAYTIVSVSLYLWHKNYFPIKNRKDLPITLTIVVGCVVEYLSINFTLGYNQSMVPCLFVMILPPMFVTFYIGGGVLRFVMLYNRSAFNLEKAALKVRREEGTSDDRSISSSCASENDSEVSVHKSITESEENRSQSRRVTVGTKTVSQLRTVRSKIIGSIDTRKLKGLQRAGSQIRTFQLLFIVSLPSLILFLVNVVQFGFRNCVGCQLSENEILVIACCALCIIFVAIHYSKKFKKLMKDANMADSLGTVKEQTSVLWNFGIGGLIWTTLNTFDPGNLQADGKVNYAYILIISVVYTQYLCTIQPVLLARSHMKTPRKKVVSPSDGDNAMQEFLSALTLTEVLEHPTWQGIFFKHLINEFASETLKYYRSVNEFKRKYSRRNDRIRWKEAFTIFETYIPDSSLLQVNICAANKEGLEKIFTGKRVYDAVHVEATIFDVSLEEILSSMERDSFPRFKATKLAVDLYTSTLEI